MDTVSKCSLVQSVTAEQTTNAGRTFGGNGGAGCDCLVCGALQAIPVDLGGGLRDIVGGGSIDETVGGLLGLG